MKAFLESIDRTPRKTNDFLVDLNMRLQRDINYLIRMQPGVQDCEQTLSLGSGSCRDTGWLLVQILRHLGLAARFVSGYLVQLKPDVKPLEGPSGSDSDFTDLHAWAEVFLPGAGWVGLDPTSGLLAGEGHLPLACTPDPLTAAPVSGTVEDCQTTFDFAMSVTRIHEDPRVTKPYTEEQWQQILRVGEEVDRRLDIADVRLTMGGEPTFVSIDDMEGAEWQIAADGPTKRVLAEDLLRRLKNRFGHGALLHYGLGKWYPGESLPRWSLSCHWRTDGEAVWKNEDLFANTTIDYGHGLSHAEEFAAELAGRLGVDPGFVINAHEDAWYYLWRERRLPINVDVRDAKLENAEERTRLARVFEQGLGSPVGCVLPLRRRSGRSETRWESGLWPVRAEQMFLIPGDSPMGSAIALDLLALGRPCRARNGLVSAGPTGSPCSAARIRSAAGTTGCLPIGRGTTATAFSDSPTGPSESRTRRLSVRCHARRRERA